MVARSTLPNYIANARNDVENEIEQRLKVVVGMSALHALCDLL